MGTHSYQPCGGNTHTWVSQTLCSLPRGKMGRKTKCAKKLFGQSVGNGQCHDCPVTPGSAQGAGFPGGRHSWRGQRKPGWERCKPGVTIQQLARAGPRGSHCAVGTGCISGTASDTAKLPPNCQVPAAMPRVWCPAEARVLLTWR